jgi:Xaa-Pro aminopeptidase
MGMSLQERDRRYFAIRELMRKDNLDCLVIASRDTYSTRGNTRYVTNHGNDFGEEVVVFPIEGDPSIIASAIRGPAIKRGGWVHNLIPISNTSEQVEAVKQELSHFDRGNKIGIVGMTYISVPVYLAVEAECSKRVVSADKEFAELRAVKSSEEIDKMRASALIADKAFTHIKDMLRPGLTDYKLYGEAKGLIHEMGCDYSMEFMTGLPYGRVIGANQMLVFEFTPAYEGYYTQLSVTLPVGEYPADIQRLIPVWKEAFRAGVDNLRPGKKVSDVQHAVSTAIREQGYTSIAHRSGHSIGLDAIDSWEIIASETTELKPGMTAVFHPAVVDERRGIGFLEPDGIYFLGGYTYLITNEGAEKLNKVDFVSL